jgi:hypothetical protein
MFRLLRQRSHLFSFLGSEREDEGNGGKYERDGGSHDHDFALAPAAFFKMMVDGRHFEDAFVKNFIAANLQNNGSGFDFVGCYWYYSYVLWKLPSWTWFYSCRSRIAQGFRRKTE